MIWSLLLAVMGMGDVYADEIPRAPLRSFAECPPHYHFHTLRFRTDLAPDEAFERLIHTASGQVWSGKSQFVQFQNESAEQKQISRPVREGDLVELDLAILLKLQHLPVYFEILELNAGARRAVFGYLPGNVTQGVQLIEMVPGKSGKGTRIIHRSCFSSGKALRDGLYPVVHTSLIKAVYRGLYRD